MGGELRTGRLPGRRIDGNGHLLSIDFRLVGSSAPGLGRGRRYLGCGV